MDKLLYIMGQLQLQASLATPAIPICDEKMQQLVETMTGPMLGSLTTPQADDMIGAVGRFAFAPVGIPGATRESSLRCLERMMKLSCEMRMCFADQGHVGRLIDLLARSDMRTEEPLILSAVDILVTLSADYMVDLRAYFCSDGLAEIVDNQMLYQCMLEPRLLGTADGPAAGEAALRLLLAITDRFLGEAGRYKESFYASFVLFLKRRGGRGGLKGARGQLVQCMLRWLLYTYHHHHPDQNDGDGEGEELDVWPLVDLEGLHAALRTVLSPHASQLAQRTHLVPLVEVLALVARQGPAPLLAQLREMLLGDEGSEYSSDAPGTTGAGTGTGAESVPQALLRLSRGGAPVELARPLGDLYAVLGQAGD
ncbi:hypothetical protein V2A60_004097 [Cordyceps javanica]